MEDEIGTVHRPRNAVGIPHVTDEVADARVIDAAAHGVLLGFVSTENVDGADTPS